MAQNKSIKIKEVCKSILRTINIILAILFIGLASGLAGAKSIELIYSMNIALGYNYAYYVSYIESGLIGTILGYFILWRKT